MTFEKNNFAKKVAQFFLYWNLFYGSNNNEEFAITRVTKSLGLLIDDKLGYEEHAERVCNKAKRSWDKASRVLGCKWSLAIPALVLLYKTIIVHSFHKHRQCGFRKIETQC